MERRSLRSSFPRDLLIATVFALVQALFAKTFLIQGFQIPSESMEPGLRVGDHILVNKLIYSGHSAPFSFLLPYREVRRGDVVVFRSPAGDGLIKRCIGMPGDLLELEGQQIQLNGESLDESPYAYLSTEKSPLSIRIADHQYFFLGDHRRKSKDSRFFGPVHQESILGRGFLVYWSVESDVPDIWDTMTSSRRPSGWFSRGRWRRIGKSIR